jgi:methylglyoxal synthase
MSPNRSEAVSMVRWIRVFLSVFALVGLLATGTSGAVAAKTQHHCANMMMHQPQGGADDSGTASKCCATGVCFAVQPTLSKGAAVSSVRTFTRVFLLPLSDATIPTLPVSPDLRPPIA